MRQSERISARFRKVLYGITGCLLAAFLYCSSASAQVSIQARLERANTYAGQPVGLSIEVTAAQQPVPKPRTPRIERVAFTLVEGTELSVDLISRRATQTFHYWVVADQPGEYELHPITVEKDGQQFVANKVTLRVVERGRPLDEAPEYFLLAKVDKDSVYVNEPVVLSFHQYSRYKPTGQINLDLNPTLFRGFWHEDIPRSQLTVRQEEMYSVQYHVVDLRYIILFPLTSGDFTIDPVELVSVLERPARRQSPFDHFSFSFGGFEGTRVQMRSNPVPLRVHPLPQEGRPEDFTGAVGQYFLKVTVDKTEVRAGEAITLLATIQGRGNLRNLPPPILPPLEGFDRYESPRRESIALEGGNMSGQVEFEYLLIPRSVEANQIEPVRFNYFNTALKMYREEKSQPITLQVLPSEKPDEETIIIGSGDTRRQIRVVGEDLRYIHTGTGVFRPKHNQDFRVPFLVSLHVLPMGLLAGFFLWVRHQKRKQEDPVWARQIEAPRQARQNLRQCERLLSENKVLEFYSLLQKTIVQYYSSRFNVPIQGLTAGERTALFESRLNDTQRAGQIEAILSACDEARFAPGAGEHQRMNDLLQQTRESLQLA